MGIRVLGYEMSYMCCEEGSCFSVDTTWPLNSKVWVICVFQTNDLKNTSDATHNSTDGLKEVFTTWAHQSSWWHFSTCPGLLKKKKRNHSHFLWAFFFLPRVHKPLQFRPLTALTGLSHNEHAVCTTTVSTHLSNCLPQSRNMFTVFTFLGKRTMSFGKWIIQAPLTLLFVGYVFPTAGVEGTLEYRQVCEELVIEIRKNYTCLSYRGADRGEVIYTIAARHSKSPLSSSFPKGF